MSDKKITIYDVLDVIMTCFSSITRPIWLDHTDNNLRVKNTAWISSWVNSNILQNYPVYTQNTGFIDPKQSLIYATDRMSWGLRIRSKIK